MTQEELRRWQEEQERQRAQRQAERQAQEAQKQTEAATQQAEQQAAQAAQNAQTAQAKTTADPVYSSPEEKAQAQGMRRTIAEYSKGVQYKTLERGDHLPHGNVNQDVSDAIDKANKKGLVKIGQTNFGVQNEIKPDYKSIKNIRQAAFFGMAISENDREKYVKQYAESIGRDYDEVLGEMEGILGDAMFASPKSTAAKQRRMQSDNNAITNSFNAYGVTNYDGTPLNFNTASFNEIVNLIKTNPDAQTREDLTDLLTKATKQKGNRFYGRTFDASDTKKFLATADFNLEKYEGFVDSHLSGKFYRTPGHDEDNEKAYSKAMDWINMQNLSEYEKNYFRKAVDLEYKRQTGNGFTGTYEPGAEASDEPQEDDEDFNLIEWLTGLFKKDSKKSDVAPTASASPAEVAVPPEAAEPTPTPVETASAPMVEEILEGMDVPETESVPATSEAKVASTPVPPEEPESAETEKPREVQGPKLPDNFPVKNISRGGIDMDALSTYYDIINGGDDVGRETGKADTEANAAKKKETIDSLSAFYDTVLKNTPTPQPKEKHGPPSPQNYIGSVDLSSQPEQALVYRMQGKEGFLTEDTLNSLDSYINGSAGRMAAAGVLTPENLKKFAKVGADGKIEEEMGNMLATDIFSYNYGLLGDLSYYALKLQDPEFPAELLPSAVGTLFQTIDEAEQHARDDKDGLYNPALVNIYSQELELYPEKKAALDAAFGYETELKEKAKEDARISAESEAKAKQERLDQAIAAFKTGDATQEDIDLVFEHAPDLNDAQLLADKTYAQYKQDIALDRTFSDVEEGGWFNDQATAYLMRNGINAEPGSVAMGQAKDYVAGFLDDAVAKLAECAYALDYGSLEAYMNSTGLKWETVQEIALHDMRVFEKGLTPEVVEKAEELAAPSYQGKGLEGYQGFAVGTAMSFEKGWADFAASKMKGWYDLAASTNLDVDSARARAYFTTNYGFARADQKASEQILAMANDGYFPNESMNAFVKDYITKGGDPFALGIVPGDLGYVVESYKKAAARSEYAQKWASRTMTPGQGKAFEVGASTVSNTSNQLLALALNVASPSTALINSMIAYGDGAYSEGFSYALDKGYGLRGGGLMGMSNALSVALANMGTDAKILNKLKPASNAINLAAGSVPLPRMLNWLKAGALAAADTLADEVIKDELTEGIYSDALMAGAEEYIKSTDNLTKAPNLSTMAKSAKAAIFGVDVVGTASKVLKNAPENFIHMLPMALMTGGSASFKTWKSYDAVKTAMKTGDPSDYVKAQQTFSEDMKDPVKANEFDKAVDAADKAVRVAEAIQDGTGDIGAVMDDAIAAQEQADSHKEKLDASQAALDEATAQHENAIEAVIAGTADEETAQEAIDSAEAIAKNQTSVAEHQKEFDQKQGEADALVEQAVGIAEAEIGQQIMSEKVAQAEAENQPYGVDNPVPYNGGTLGMTNINTGEYGEVVGIVGKDGAGFPVVKLNNGKAASVEDMDWDQGVEDFSEIMEQFADVEDQLPLFEKDENGEWSQKPDFVPPVSDFSNMSKSKIAGMADLQTITLGEDGSVVSDTKAESSAESEADLTTGDGSALEEAEIDELPDLDSDNTYPYKHLDHEYSATMLVDGELEPVSVLDMVGYTSVGGNPVFELSNGKYVTIDALSNVEGNLYDDALDAMFDAPDGSMLKFQPGQYVTFADLNAGEGAAEAEGDLKYLKSTQSNQGASSMPKSDTKKKSAKVNSPLRIAKKLADDIGTTIYGRKKLSDPHTLKPLPKSVKAYYSDMLDILGVRAKDSGKIIDMFHELMHAIGNKIKMEGTQRMIDALRDDFKANYSDAELPGEALAEFGWHYFFAPQEAEKIAGAKFVADFEAALKREGLYKAVKDAQEDLQLYRNQDVSGRSLAHVVDTPSKQKKNVFTTLLGEGVDETAYLRLIVNRLAQKFGWNKISANMNPVIQARQAQTASLRADRVFDNAVTDANWKVVGKSFEERVSKYIKTAKDADEFLAYILDKHALERSKQGKPVFDGVAISDSELRSNIKRIETEMPHIAEAANEMYEFWDDVMTNYMVDTGFMSEATWQYLKTLNPFYVPTMRDKGITNSGGTGGNKFAVRRATGSTEDIINPLVTMRAMVEQMVKQVSYNNVALSVDRAYKAMPEAMADILIPVAKGESKAKPALTEADIKQIEANLKPGDDLMEAILTEMEKRAAFGQPAKSGEPGTMVVQHADGSTTEYKVLDPDMFSAITGGGEKGVVGLAQTIARLTRTMSALTTASNPIFGTLRNPFRDIGTSINYGSWAFSYIDGIPKWLLAMTDVMRNTDDFKQFLATGAGSMSMFSSRSPKTANKFLNKVLPGRKPTTKKGKLVSALGSAYELVTLQQLGEWIELTSRYVEAKYGNVNVKNANAEAGDFSQLGINQRDVTVDFYGKGKNHIAADIACISPFFRAAMNGIYRQARMYADPMERNRLPARVAKSVVNTALASAASSLLMLGMLDDEEKEAYSEYLSQNLKTQHWYLPNPAYDSGDSDKRFIRIPLPQDVASYAVHAAVTNAIWLGQEDSLAIEAGAAMDNILSSLWAYNGTVFKPFIDATFNRTWYGGYIVPRTMTDYKKISAANQYTETTPELFKLAGKAFNLSPMKLQYVVEQLGGYPAKMLIPALSPDEFTGELGGFEAIGEVWEKAMTSDPYVSQDMTSTFYDAKNLLTEIQNDATEGKSVLGLKAGLSQAQVDDAVFEAKSLLKGPIKEGQDAIKEMYDTVDAINANQDLSSKQKNALIRDARKTCMEVLADVNAEMWAYQEQYCTGESLIGRFIKNYKTYSLSTK